MTIVRFSARSITLPLSVVGVPGYHGRDALADAIAAARRALQAQG
jgi:hypothetical protein